MAPNAPIQTQNVGTSNPPLTPNNAVEIFDDIQAAAYVGGIKPRAIRDWRTRRGLPFIRITAKVCRIRRTDLDRWLNRHQVAITRGAV
jgi:Helix-turn-helix domain